MLASDWAIILQDYVIFLVGNALVSKIDARLVKKLVLQLQEYLTKYWHLDAWNIFVIALVGLHNIQDYFLFDLKVHKLGNEWIWDEVDVLAFR